MTSEDQKSSETKTQGHKSGGWDDVQVWGGLLVRQERLVGASSRRHTKKTFDEAMFTSN